MIGFCVCVLLFVVVAAGEKRKSFLDKAKECEEKCEGRRKSLPECDLFCIDDACYQRVFGQIDLISNTVADLDNPKKIEAFTRCAKLRLLPAIPEAYRGKKALKDEQKRQMQEWRARLEQRREAADADKRSALEQQKADRAQLERRKAEKRQKQRAAAKTQQQQQKQEQQQQQQAKVEL